MRYYLRDFQRLRILKFDKNGSDQSQLFYLKFKINLALINSYRSGTWAILKLLKLDIFSNNLLFKQYFFLWLSIWDTCMNGGLCNRLSSMIA